MRRRIIMKKVFCAFVLTLLVTLTLNLLTFPVGANKTGTEPQSLKQKGKSLGGSFGELQMNETTTDETGITHTKTRQTIDGVPVWNGEAIVHLNPDGSIFAVTDETIPDLAVSTQPVISSAQATDTALLIYGNGTYPVIVPSPTSSPSPSPSPTVSPSPLPTATPIANATPVATSNSAINVDSQATDSPSAVGDGGSVLTAAPLTDLWVWRGSDRDHLVYRVQMERLDGSDLMTAPVYFIDAETNEKVFGYDNLETQTATGSGPSLYSGNVSFLTYRASNLYYLEDLSRRLGTFDYYSGRLSDYDNYWNGSSQRAAVDAHWGAERTLDYYSTTHGRNGLNGSGGPGYNTAVNGTPVITSFVHAGSSLNNAFWTGQYMMYGDGDGSTFSPLTTLDICGHELTHGVTQYSAALIYQGESGALNEAMSDVFGSMVERYTKGESANTWKIGEDAYTPYTAGDALRYMDNPTRGGQPDNYADRYLGSADNGGVHTNSGIANYAFYLLAKGGTTRRGGTMTGIGADKAARIWYRALTSYMTSGTNFAGARTATLNAANAIYGSNSAEAIAVSQSWCLVGVGTCTNTCGTLSANQSLGKGQSLSSCNGLARLIFQNDGNVVLYKYTGQALWNTGTYNRPDANRLVMQGDGNFVLYSNSNQAIWNSGTYRYPGAVLRVQDDRNMVIYATNNAAVWQTGTAGR